MKDVIRSILFEVLLDFSGLEANDHKLRVISESSSYLPSLISWAVGVRDLLDVRLRARRQAQYRQLARRNVCVAFEVYLRC